MHSVPVLSFEFIPLESLIKDHQQDDYQALEKSDRAGDSTHFVEFSLKMIHLALEDFLQNFSPKPLSAAERLDRARQEFSKKKFSRKDDLALFKTISTATASRHRQPRPQARRRLRPPPETGRQSSDRLRVPKVLRRFSGRGSASRNEILPEYR